jgi:imidazole glycerol phosphate synthase subunit HisF
VKLGAGEIVVNSIDADGTQAGYDLELYARFQRALLCPCSQRRRGEPEDLTRP